MNPAQYAAACAVIRTADDLCSDALILAQRAAPRGFVCCAVGELALVAGHTVPELAAVLPRECDRYATALPKLRAVFGLTDDDCQRISEANDDPSTVLTDAELRAQGAHASRAQAVTETLDDIVARYERSITHALNHAGSPC